MGDTATGKTCRDLDFKSTGAGAESYHERIPRRSRWALCWRGGGRDLSDFMGAARSAAHGAHGANVAEDSGGDADPGVCCDGIECGEQELAAGGAEILDEVNDLLTKGIHARTACL
jgi:hypothetical protein